MAENTTNGTSSRPLARLFPDLPVDDGEPLDFDFEGVARTLAELALNPENRTPFTIVVRGGWGRGKTTLLKRAQWLLANPAEAGFGKGLRRVEPLWFTAWKYPSEDTVLAGLLGALLDRLHKGNKGEQLRKLVDAYGGSILGAVLRLAAPAPLKALLGEVKLENRFSPVEEKRAFHDTFRELFSQVSRLLFDPKMAVRDGCGRAEVALWSRQAQQRETLAIFLDDLDRCREERVREVLEAINLFLDLPGVCFYLGLDWERLVRALPETVRGDGSQFLEKIVQVALDLPAVSAGDAADYMRDRVRGSLLEPILGDGELQVVAAALESRHPRHIKRFLNDLAMTLGVLRNAERLGDGEGQVPPAAVLVWQLLSEVLAAETWRELRALPANVRAFLREAAARRATAKAGEGKPDSSAEWQQLRARGLEERHFQALAQLSDGQLHVLVHLASPAVAPPAPSAGLGRLGLADLASDAWVRLPAGGLTMGADDKETDERPAHQVTLSAFAISRHPVTNADYAAFVQETGKWPPSHWPEGKVPAGKAHHPVVNVSWADAEAFATWLTRWLAAGGAEGTVQLPTEAQWEYAARGTAGREYPWGSEVPDRERANYGGTVGDTTPVGAYPLGATPEGVYDLAGNVWEWCRDWYGDYAPAEQRNPLGAGTGSARVLRGGAFYNNPGALRAAFRNRSHPEARFDRLGFRLVWSGSAGLDGA